LIADSISLLSVFFRKKDSKYCKQKNMKQKIKTCLLLLVILTAVSRVVYAQEISRINMQTIKMVYIVDSVVTVDSFSSKMGKGYGILFTLLGQQQLKPSKVMAMYHTITPPYIFDIAVEVDREPVQLNNGVQFKTINGGDAIVVHYKGAYEKIEKAYLQIEEWLKKNNKRRAESPIEVYLNDPATVKDKSELLTDIYQLIR
jgi:effector-binding domain-containing protein